MIPPTTIPIQLTTLQATMTIQVTTGQTTMTMTMVSVQTTTGLAVMTALTVGVATITATVGQALTVGVATIAIVALIAGQVSTAGRLKGVQIMDYGYLIIGILLIVGGIIYHTIGKKWEKLSRKTNDYKSTDDISPTTKFEHLKAGDFVEFSHNLSQKGIKEYQVSAQGILQCLSGKERNFIPNKDEDLFFVLGYYADYVIIKFKDGNWVAFDQKIPLVGDEADEFNQHGIAFCKKSQIPDSYEFTWRNIYLSVIDVGYMRYLHETGNDFELPDNTEIKFMLAHDGDTVFYLENHKTGPDCVRLGHDLGYDLDQYLGDIHRK